MKNFKTYQLALRLFRESRNLKLPSAEMKQQFERAMISLVLNLAEGSGRLTMRDRQRFYIMSLGSLREIQAIFELVGNMTFFKQADQLAGSIYRLIQNPGSGIRKR